MEDIIALLAEISRGLACKTVVNRDVERWVGVAHSAPVPDLLAPEDGLWVRQSVLIIVSVAEKSR